MSVASSSRSRCPAKHATGRLKSRYVVRASTVSVNLHLRERADDSAPPPSERCLPGVCPGRLAAATDITARMAAVAVMSRADGHQTRHRHIAQTFNAHHHRCSATQAIRASVPPRKPRKMLCKNNSLTRCGWPALTFAQSTRRRGAAGRVIVF